MTLYMCYIGDMSRLHVDVVGLKAVLYDSGRMASGVVMLINDTT